MGLFAREIEEADIPTLILSATLDITASVKPPAPVIKGYSGQVPTQVRSRVRLP